ncbi:MAG: shikimate 5-dehydrogenase [Clostridia bacterium]|nr:shikimate 5-dehydrogenase [Clostridia bacterium]
MTFRDTSERVRAALIGKPLGHSYSKLIHEKFGYGYDLVETDERDLEKLLRSGEYTGFNVTVPYKKTVIPLLDELDPSAAEVGSVNTIKARKRRLIGYNTDVYGMEKMLAHAGINLYGRTVMILGTGGTSLTATKVSRRGGAKDVIVVGRNSPVNYENCYLRKGVNVIINATPVGMFPSDEESPIRVEDFKELEGVADAIYNPLRTKLVRNALAEGVRATGGLKMLVEQAVRAAEIFTDGFISDGVADKIYREIRSASCGVAFIGMPGSGKTTLGKAAAKLLKKKFIDTDEEIEKRCGKSIPEIFGQDGEEYFRKVESEVIADAAKERNAVVATGGGAVLREENRYMLRKNSVIINVERKLENLERDGRPLSSSEEKLAAMYRERYPIYRDLGDFCIENDGSVKQAEEKIKEILA